MEPLNNPMAQAAKMYSMIEAHLRRAAADNKPLSLYDLRKKEDIKATEKDNSQVKLILKYLRKNNYITSQGHTTNTSYMWNLEAPPFVLPVRLAQQAPREPSEVRAHVPEQLEQAWSQPGEAPRAAKVVVPKSDEVELVVNGNVIIIGVNPATGRPRITLDF